MIKKTMVWITEHKLILSLFLLTSASEFIKGQWQEQISLSSDQELHLPSLSINVSHGESIEVIRYQSFFVNYSLGGDLTECVEVAFKSSPRIITTLPSPSYFCPDNLSSYYIVQFDTIHEGTVEIEVVADPTDIISTDEAIVSLSVKITEKIDTVSAVVGWIYTIAWDISFLPQIIHNWRRQSVVGLSFDFITLNFIGFSCYFFYNMGLYWIVPIQAQYELRHPTSILHVRLNDVIFPLYACICTAVQIIQCFIYERGNQRVSVICRIIATLLLTSVVIYAILTGVVEHIWWLDFLYWLSFVKLAITCIKYIPQLFINYKTKSTEGWSIWQVILDFTGGSFSLIQMFLLAYNYDDFHSVLTDPSKLGLGLLAIFFNIFFFMQHYCIYSTSNSSSKNEDTIDKEKQNVQVMNVQRKKSNSST